MIDNVKVSAHQLLILVFLYSIGTVILHTPSLMAHIAKQDAWIAAIIGTGAGIILTGLYIKVGNLFPSLSLDRLNEKLFGRFIGKAVNTFFFFWAFVSASEIVFYIGDFVATFWMPETPSFAIHIMFSFIVILAVRLGIEPISRLTEILFLPVTLLLVILIIAIVPKVEWMNIQPVLEFGIRPILRAALVFVSFFSFSSVMFLMIYPSLVTERKKAAKGFLKGTIYAGIILVIVMSLNILVLGVDLTTRNIAPSYALARKINIGNFVTRIEAFLALFWIMTVFIRGVVYFYVSVVVFSNIFEVKDYRHLCSPLGMIMVVFSLILFPNIQAAATYDKDIWLPFVSVVGLFMPLLLLVAARIRNWVDR
jgi:spore germination protein KB